MKGTRIWLAVAVAVVVGLAVGLSLHGGPGASRPAPGEAAKTPQLGPCADLGGMRLFGPDDPWNQDISNAKVDPMSDALIRSIGAAKPLHPDFGTVWDGAPCGIPYVAVPKDQKKVKITFTGYSDECDKGPYPVPMDAPIEGGPKSDGDRHVLVLDLAAGMLYEMWQATPKGDGWEAGSGAVFDLSKPGAQRPQGWTSADAAGLPILPGLVRYDEAVLHKEIKHALRFTVQKSRRAYVPPARHWASNSKDPNRPPMGMRVRLKAGVDISGFAPEVQVILTAMKKYGMIVADNGSDWYISGSPDPRWDDDDLHTLGKIKGQDFEVITMDGLVADK